MVASLSQRGEVRRLRASRPLVQPREIRANLVEISSRALHRGANLRRSRVRSERARRSFDAHPRHVRHRSTAGHRRTVERRRQRLYTRSAAAVAAHATGGSEVMFHLQRAALEPLGGGVQTIHRGGEVRTRTRRRGEVDGRGGGRGGLTGVQPRVRRRRLVRRGRVLQTLQTSLRVFRVAERGHHGVAQTL